ncbi:LGFP repeat-containing protein [Nocardia suismassiliense]|uniref:LGFP repeat-containing protein n=1 Tax=Nocardia suismassiliense TaxID=2077092 RepID=UPI001F3D51DB|nr:hypothetical protein [Nocardia suismassiliense]
MTIVLSSAVSASADGQYGDYIVGGRIEQEYLARGGPSVLGNPTMPESDAARGGRYQMFANSASIYWHSQVAGGWAKLVQGAIRGKWGQFGWENGPLRYPIESEFTGKDGGRGSHFEGGSIYWKSSAGAHPVWGAIRDQWANQGWENGPMGYPISDEYDIAGGAEQLFEGGVLQWNVGAEPDDDPNGTDPIIGADDPYNKFASRYVERLTDSGDRCSTADAAGKYVCMGFGKNTAPGPDPSSTDSRSATPNETPAPTTTSAIPSAPPSSTVPSPSSPSATAPGSPAPTPPASHAPAQTSPAPATTTSGPAPASPAPAAPQFRPFPVRQAPPTEPIEPPDPARDLAAEAAFFTGAQGQVGNWCVNADMAVAVGKRFYGCATSRYRLTYYQRYEGKTYKVGWEKGFAYRETKTAVSSQATTERIKFDRKVANGTAGAATVTLDLTVEGSTSRTGTVNPSGRQTKALAPKPEFTFTTTTRLAGASNKWEWDTLMGKVIFADPLVPLGLSNPLTHELRFARTRCDSYSYIGAAPGCVLAPGSGSNNRPVLDLTTTKQWAPQLYDHVLNAQNSLLPGSPVGIGTSATLRPLQRIVYKSQQHRSNRATACPNGRAGYNRPGADWQCDEYPFAVTAQGALSYPDLGRTFDWCSITVLPIGVYNANGFSACFIPTTQNGDGGRLLPSFHRENRILYVGDDDSDGYFVQAYHG